MKPLSDDSRQLVESLQKAVAAALDHKRRLGQYAVIWRDGAPAFIGPNPPASPDRAPVAANARHRRVSKQDTGRTR